MIDFEILTEAGTTNERLRELFTAVMPSHQKVTALKKTAEGKATLKGIEKDMELRKKFELRIADWLSEQIIFSLDNASLYAAVDLAWDGAPINKLTLPLMLYAQGRIDTTACAKALKNLPGSDQYVKKNTDGKGGWTINLPKFYSMEVNIGRSVVTRRVAAQSNKYNKLWPFFKYESRSTSAVGRLKADAVSQRMDIMADQYDFRHQQTQVVRDMFLYARSVEFPRSAWEREVQWEKRDLAAEFKPGKGIEKKAVVVREGVKFIAPHPGRVIYDNSHPLASLNTDTGCEWVGFWDVARYGALRNNPDFFNRESIGFSADTAAWFQSYSSYFSQYYETIVAPELPQELGARNDRKNSVGLYTGEMEESSVFLTELFVKVLPQEWGIGTYPYPVWVHLKVAGDSTVIFAEIMPSSPAVVTSYNENDSRLKNISMMMELLGYQDQLTNLYTMLLETIKADLFAVAVLNEDIFPDTEAGRKVKESFRQTMAGTNFAGSMNMLEVSFNDLKQLGIDPSADNIFKIVRSAPNDKIGEIITAISSVIQMAERMMTLSAHEQGQAVEHEISATESATLSRSTDTIFDFIGQAIDEGRAAKKRIIYESMIAMGSREVSLPVINRYPPHVIAKAGFTMVDTDDDGEAEAVYATIKGASHLLRHDFIFTSRDGGDRASGVAGATALVQWITAIGQLPEPMSMAIMQKMGKEKLFEIFNEILSLSGAGVDARLETQAGESDDLLPEQGQEVMQGMQRLAQMLQVQQQDIAAIKQAIGQPAGGMVPPGQAA